MGVFQTMQSPSIDDKQLFSRSLKDSNFLEERVYLN